MTVLVAWGAGKLHVRRQTQTNEMRRDEARRAAAKKGVRGFSASAVNVVPLICRTVRI